uniref:Formiminotransferase-cyclodeaminase n=1 Tax=uncultured Elusimicrobia bacterium TaxID=699876 RepID=A0A650EM01_9BACT|nr:formiminotransferase-cyclodeaminase [uncultured Elusimicrobia bacterium]
MEWYTAADKFTEALASSDPTPGGGAAAAQAGAMGCALAMMAVGTTLKRKATPPADKPVLEASLKCFAALKNELKIYVKQDGEAYAAFITVQKLPKDNPDRESAMQNALWQAAKVPADAAATAVRALKELDEIKDRVAAIILSDVVCARHLLQACIRCAAENVRANQAYIKNADKTAELDKLTKSFLKFC